MNGERTYPDEPAGPFLEPPFSFQDADSRSIEIRPADHEEEALVTMYRAFDPADRAQGIPPTGERRIREWLEVILDEGPDVAAYHGDAIIGHATLVPDGTGAYELAIFVLADYQHAGIGTRLIEGLLGLGSTRGIERVWLTVERWNTPAIDLYRKVGFETVDAESFELEMSLRLSEASVPA